MRLLFLVALCFFCTCQSPKEKAVAMDNSKIEFQPLPKFSNAQVAVLKKNWGTVGKHLKNPAHYYIAEIRIEEKMDVIQLAPLRKLRDHQNPITGAKTITLSEAPCFAFDKGGSLIEMSGRESNDD